MERLKQAFQPNASWGPSSIQERRAWEDYKYDDDDDDQGFDDDYDDGDDGDDDDDHDD